MKKILIIGNYGIDGKLNGQTARTRTVTKTIKKIYNEYSISTINTRKVNLITIFKFIVLSIRAKKIIIMPGKKSLKTIVNIFNFLHLLKKTYYVVIGGWIYDYVLIHPKLLKKIKKINCSFVQIESLKTNLLSLNINSKVLPNYRIYNKDIVLKPKNDKYIFYSRIREDKGILIAIDAINNINACGEKVYLDIYGPIDKNFENIFYNKIENNKYINYCGVLSDNNEIIEVLSQYKFLLFPTYYEGEGYPGVIVEAMTASLPVITTDWKYNSEIINDGENGFIIKAKSTKDLEQKIKLIENNTYDLKSMQKNCKKTSKKYTEEKVIEILKNTIGK